MKAKNLIKSILPGIAAALAGCFMLFIYAPFELYFTNQMEFWFTAGQMLPMALAMFAAGFALCVLLLLAARRINEKLYYVLLAAGVIAVLCCYVQGNFLVSGLPGLDGAVIDWNAYPAERLKCVLLWVVVTAAVAAAARLLGRKKFESTALALCAALALLLGVTLATLALTTERIDKHNENTSTELGMFQMSENRNFLILILDAMDGCTFDKVLDRDEAYRDYFDGFTYYDNAMSGFGFSKGSAPLILTGQWYEAEQDFLDYIREAMDNSPFFDRLDSEGYEKGLYTNDPFLLASLTKEEFPNLTDQQPDVTSKAVMCKLLSKMTIIKYAPWDAKRLGYDLLGRLNECRGLDPDSEYGAYFDWTDSTFYSYVKDANPVETTGENCFKFMHLEGGHEPHVYNADMVVTEDGNYTDTLEACVKMCGALFERYKEAGVYDNTVIVLLADHGYADGSEGLDTWQQHPILFIKGINERHALKTDSAPISYGDLQEAYLKLMDGKASDEVFDWHEGDERERRFMKHNWTNTDHIEEYVQTGRAEDMDTLVPTGRVFDYIK